MKIEITASGIFGADGEIPVGTVVDMKSAPQGWNGRYRIVSGETEGKTAITNPAKEADPAREDLKKQANELGLEFPRNISTEKLKELVDAKLAE